MENIISGHGVVIMIDALGTRGFTIEKCKEFLIARSELMKISDPRWIAASSHSENSGNSSVIEMHTMSFADSLIMAIEMKGFASKHGKMNFPTGENDIDNIFYGLWMRKISYLLGDFIRDAIKKQIAFRGAMSFGEFILHKESCSLLGPAINDVAYWYETLDSFGIILTPYASDIFRWLKDKEKVDTPHKTFTKEPDSVVSAILPIKNKTQNKITEMELFSVNWPNAYCHYKSQAIDKEIAKKQLLDDIARIDKTSSSKHKYNNALDFFDKAPCPQV